MLHITYLLNETCMCSVTELVRHGHVHFALLETVVEVIN